MKTLVIHITIYRKLLITVLYIFICTVYSYSQPTKSFASLDEVLAYTKLHHHRFSQAELQTNLAKLTRQTASANLFDPKVPSSIQIIDHLRLQRMFLPGPIFGQEEGTFRPVTMGQKYNSTFSLQPQFDILNIGAIAQLKSAKINEELVTVQHKLNERDIYEQINAIYFNILSFQAQKSIIAENIVAAEEIFRITKHRFEEDIGRIQDVNEAEVNLISLRDMKEQLGLNNEIQHQSLKLFFENQADPLLTESLWDYESIKFGLTTSSGIQSDYDEWQLRMAEQDERTARLQQLPTLSFISSFNWQNLSTDFFFHPGSDWIYFNYIGLKLTYELPTSVSKLSNVKSKKIQRQIAQYNFEHAILENETANRQMTLDYEKAVAQSANLKRIYELKKDTYEKYLQQFNENILSLDRLLIAQGDMLGAQLQWVNALASVGFYQNKIGIHNKF